MTRLSSKMIAARTTATASTTATTSTRTMRCTYPFLPVVALLLFSILPVSSTSASSSLSSSSAVTYQEVTLRGSTKPIATDKVREENMMQLLSTVLERLESLEMTLEHIDAKHAESMESIQTLLDEEMAKNFERDAFIEELETRLFDAEEKLEAVATTGAATTTTWTSNEEDFHRYLAEAAVATVEAAAACLPTYNETLGMCFYNTNMTNTFLGKTEFWNRVEFNSPENSPYEVYYYDDTYDDNGNATSAYATNATNATNATTDTIIDDTPTQQDLGFDPFPTVAFKTSVRFGTYNDGNNVTFGSKTYFEDMTTFLSGAEYDGVTHYYDTVNLIGPTGKKDTPIGFDVSGKVNMMFRPEETFVVDTATLMRKDVRVSLLEPESQNGHGHHHGKKDKKEADVPTPSTPNIYMRSVPPLLPKSKKKSSKDKEEEEMPPNLYVEGNAEMDGTTTMNGDMVHETEEDTNR